MEKIIYLLLCTALPLFGFSQQTLTGTVVSAENGLPLPGALVQTKNRPIGANTNEKGVFTLEMPDSSVTLLVSYLGHETAEIHLLLPLKTSLVIRLFPDAEQLEKVVVSTGYYEIPKERATGSFTHIDNKLINRSAGTDIIARLEGVTPGLAFDTRSHEYPGGRPTLRLRGLGTVYANESPLIVVDNFPFEGDIRNINPNDVESVTVLKDAAAASIWGARAGNGVIVITTKKGRFNQPLKVSFNSSLTIKDRPDVFYNPNYLSSHGFIAVERKLFERGFYEADETSLRKTPLSPVVETLIGERDGLISSTEANSRIALWERLDVRRDIQQYLYRQGVNQQYALNINGGTKDIQYYFSGGLDLNHMGLRGNKQHRLTLNTANTFRITDRLSLTAGIAHVQGSTTSNGLRREDITVANKSLYPYARLADGKGRPLPIAKNYRASYTAKAAQAGLLDWQYRPLQEIGLTDNVFKNTATRITADLGYRFSESLDMMLKYQYRKSSGERRTLWTSESYYARNMANRFTQENGELVFPLGGVLELDHSEELSHSARGQLNYDFLKGRHRLDALAGVEVRQVRSTANGFRQYGYDNEVLTSWSQLDYLTRFPVRPIGFDRIPVPTGAMNGLLDRFVSYYANASYTYNDRYTLSFSARRDGSNLFGVKTNQKGVPLWSAGIGWRVSEEPFYQIEWLPYLKFRATYGYNGNVDRSVTAFPTAYYSTDNLTGLKYAEIESPGNPQLRWERVGIWNLGLDFGGLNDRFSGSLEYYRKKGVDLIGDMPLDPTTGYLGDYRLNYADMLTEGVEVELVSHNMATALTWQTNILFSYVENRVTRYHFTENGTVGYFGGLAPPVEGLPLYRVYSYPWTGLDPDTGDPFVMLDGKSSKEYREFIQGSTLEDLVYHGPQLPTFFGSLRNTFGWKGFRLGLNITWKAGYYFRRSSINYDLLFNNWRGHRDFYRRWQKPGDELVTQVPSMPEVIIPGRAQVYKNSSLLIEKGDHIRLQDISLGYTFTKSNWSGLPLQSLGLYLYARDLGIIWKAGKEDLDPDYPRGTILPPKSFAFGIRANF